MPRRSEAEDPEAQGDYAKFGVICDDALRPIDKTLGGVTGAQYGAAKWLAWQWCFNGGPAALIARAKERGQEDRIIQASKHFPNTIGIMPDGKPSAAS
jgi:hypothetical protein